MAEYSIFSVCTKNYRDAYEFSIDSWLRTDVKYIYIYTDDPDWKSDNDRVKIIKLFGETDDWLTNIGRKVDAVRHAVTFGDERLIFMDIDCYLVNDIGYVFDVYDFDFAVTRLHRTNIDVSSGIYFFLNTPANRKFIDVWDREQKVVRSRGIGVKPFAGSYGQAAFSNVMRRYYNSKTRTVIDLDVNRYNKKVGKPTQKSSAIADIKNKKVDVLHFYARTWRSSETPEILSYLDKKEVKTGRLCITTVVSRSYQKFIPMFTLFCLKSYPEYGIKLFLTEKLKPAYANIINQLRKLGNIELVEGRYGGYPRSPHELKTLRWITTSDDFREYDYVYVGDIDIMICREEDPLLYQHLRHCEETGLPYSNSVRPNSNRLSGLHFIKKDEYYLRMDPIIKKKYRKLLKAGKLFGIKNEEILYNMIRKVKFDFPKGWFRPHHGLHLRVWKNKPRKVSAQFWQSVGRENYKKYYEFYKSVKNDPLYKEAYRLDPLREFHHMERSLDEEFQL
jgi:hypothetical protein